MIIIPFTKVFLQVYILPYLACVFTLKVGKLCDAIDPDDEIRMHKALSVVLLSKVSSPVISMKTQVLTRTAYIRFFTGQKYFNTTSWIMVGLISV